ncbi:MAG: hypothetical protein PHV42_02215 [Candidatus Pacebacteria bacterium]|nr:hypothetical protein [Candidatus Paceibacterota bacterium]
MKIVAIKSGIFKDRIKVIAERDEAYKSTTGIREWWLKKGQAVTLRVPKSKMFQVNEEVSFEYCIKMDIGGPYSMHYPQIPCKQLK